MDIDFYRIVITAGRRKEWGTKTRKWEEGMAFPRGACWVWEKRQGTENRVKQGLQETLVTGKIHCLHAHVVTEITVARQTSSDQTSN